MPGDVRVAAGTRSAVALVGALIKEATATSMPRPLNLERFIVTPSWDGSFVRPTIVHEVIRRCRMVGNEIVAE
jgi:hypothetical protein